MHKWPKRRQVGGRWAVHGCVCTFSKKNIHTIANKKSLRVDRISNNLKPGERGKRNTKSKIQFSANIESNRNKLQASYFVPTNFRDERVTAPALLLNTVVQKLQ